MISFKKNIETPVKILEGSNFSVPDFPKGVSEKVITESNEEAQKLTLTRGEYKISVTLGDVKNAKEKTVFNTWFTIDAGDERKRVFARKVDITPNEDGTANMVATFSVVDNPLPLIPIIWGVAAIGTLSAGWFFIDKTETFVEDSTFNIVSILLSIFLIFFVAK